MQVHKPLVLVTGASGFTAGHIIQHLCLAGYKVRGTVRNVNSKDCKHICTLGNDIELIECDLTSDKNWDKAVYQCDYVIHTAGIVSGRTTEHLTEEEFVTPVVQSMQRLLNECLKNKSVKTLVYTSSIVSLGLHMRPLDYKNICLLLNGDIWTNIDRPAIGSSKLYKKSKILCEKLMFEFAKKHNNPFRVVCINPAMTFGPLLDNRFPESLRRIRQLFLPTAPIYPRYYGICDVRDVALAHVLALTCEKANGKRYLISNTALWQADLAKFLKFEFEEKGYGISETIGSLSYFENLAKKDSMITDYILDGWDELRLHDSKPSVQDLGLVYRHTREVLMDTVQSLIDFGFVAKPTNAKL